MKKTAIYRKYRETTEENLPGKLVNHLIKNGKKSVAEKIYRDAALILRKKYGKDISELLREAMVHGGPLMVIRQRRKGAQKLRVPFPLTESQRLSMGLRWLVLEARKASGRNLAERLADIIYETSQDLGAVAKRSKQVSHEVARSRGNSFLRW